MTTLSALLALKSATLKEAGVLIALMQCAEPTGALTVDHDEIRKQYNRVFGKRITTPKYEELVRSLSDKGLIPSTEAVYPMPEDTGLDYETAEQIVDALEADWSEVRPDASRFPDDERIFAALKAADVLEIATKRRRQRLTTEERNQVVVAEGEQVQYWQKTWDYAFIGKLKRDYNTTAIIDTVFEIALHRGFEDVAPPGDNWEKRRRHLRQYLIGALQGEIDPANESFDYDLIY